MRDRSIRLDQQTPPAVLLRVVCCGVLFLFAAIPLHADVYYVRPDGDDARSGRSPEEAWRNIDRGQPTVLTRPTSAGDTVVHVEKANQFPPQGRARIGGTVFCYTARTLTTLTGCEGVPAARAGAMVHSVEYKPPGPGDAVLVMPGVYYLPLSAAGDKPPAVVVVRSGGDDRKPVIFRGAPGTVVDGRFQLMSWKIDHASHVRIEGFDIRRGGLFVWQSDGIEVAGNRVHEGARGITVAYSRNCEIARNLVFDFYGAWTNHGITIGASRDCRVHHNTVVASGWGIKSYSTRGLIIDHNLIAWCDTGVVFDERQPVEDWRIEHNNVWACGPTIWLQRDDQIGRRYYSGIVPEPETDTHLEPLIVNWDPRRQNFLALHSRSPLVRKGRAEVGAVTAAAEYPDAGHYPGENLILNASFEADLLGWWISSWQDLEGDRAGCEVVGGNVADGERCIKLWEKRGRDGPRGLRLCSSMFRYTRGRPLTVSFLARSETEGNSLSVGLGVPSWQNKSGVGQRIRLSTEWQRYALTLGLPPRFPDVAWVEFTTAPGTFWIDAVKVEEGSEATPFSPLAELVPEVAPGMLCRPKARLRGRVLHRGTEPTAARLRWQLFAPLYGEIARGEQRVELLPQSSTPVEIALPRDLQGIFSLRYEVVAASGAICGTGQFRFCMDEPAPRAGRNDDFFAATPPIGFSLPGALWQHQCAALADLGLGTFHVYGGYQRMAEMLTSGSRLERLIDESRAAGFEWLFTPSDAQALTGQRTWAPAPGNVSGSPIEVRLSEEESAGRCTPEQLDRWAKLVGQVAARYANRIRYWEVLNEPNTFLSGDEYARVLRVTSAAIRRTAPSAHIVAGSVVNAHRRELYQSTVAAPPGTFDSFSFHPYRFGLINPETNQQNLRQMVREILEDLRAGGHPPRIFVTEEGMGSGFHETRCIRHRLSYSSMIRVPWFTEGEIRQAGYAARMYLTVLGEGGIGYNYHTLQGLANDAMMTPMLALKALHTMDRVLGDAEPEAYLELGPDYRGYLFRQSDGRLTAAIWTVDAEYARLQRISLPGERVARVIGMFGETVPLERSDAAGSDSARRGVSFMLGREVVYLEFTDRDVGATVALLEEAFRELTAVPGP